METIRISPRTLIDSLIYFVILDNYTLSDALALRSVILEKKHLVEVLKVDSKNIKATLQNNDKTYSQVFGTVDTQIEPCLKANFSKPSYLVDSFRVLWVPLAYGVIVCPAFLFWEFLSKTPTHAALTLGFALFFIVCIQYILVHPRIQYRFTRYMSHLMIILWLLPTLSLLFKV